MKRNIKNIALVIAVMGISSSCASNVSIPQEYMDWFDAIEWDSQVTMNDSVDMVKKKIKNESEVFIRRYSNENNRREGTSYIFYDSLDSPLETTLYGVPVVKVGEKLIMSEVNPEDESGRAEELGVIFTYYVKKVDYDMFEEKLKEQLSSRYGRVKRYRKIKYSEIGYYEGQVREGIWRARAGFLKNHKVRMYFIVRDIEELRKYTQSYGIMGTEEVVKVHVVIRWDK